MSPRICVIDTYYGDFLSQWRFNESAGYEAELNRLLDFEFGTGRAYSRNLKALGWQCHDIIANAKPLQEMWVREEYGGNIGYSLRGHINLIRPDVVFFQDLSCMNAGELSLLKSEGYVLAGQCSCPMPPYENVKEFDILFTSFPHYLRRFEEACVRAVYNPLGFESTLAYDKIETTHMLSTEREYANSLKDEERIHDVVFIGGVGNPGHWRRGMETLHAVAEAIPTFKWWGYGVEHLPEGPLKQKYCGSAFGIDMYKILAQSRIVLNRHGEVAEGYAQNMKLFETTGMGAMLLTEEAPNLRREFFAENECVAYDSPRDAIDKLKFYLTDVPSLFPRTIAANGQKKTIELHTYAQRIKTVSDNLLEMLHG